MNKLKYHKQQVLTFRHFTRKGYSLFACLNKQVRIGMLGTLVLTNAYALTPQASMAQTQDNRTNLLSTESSADEVPIDWTLLEEGDLLFTVTAPSGSSQHSKAITDVVNGYGEYKINHVAIVCLQNAKHYALEASMQHGVWLNPIEQFFEKETKGNQTYIIQGRLKEPSLAKPAVQKALSYLGKPYDLLFSPTEDAIYCSELVQLAYKDEHGNALFEQQPMSFHDETGKITAYWENYYKQYNLPVPEGEPGSHPGGISRSQAITIIRQFF